MCPLLFFIVYILIIDARMTSFAISLIWFVRSHTKWNLFIAVVIDCSMKWSRTIPIRFSDEVKVVGALLSKRLSWYGTYSCLHLNQDAAFVSVLLHVYACLCVEAAESGQRACAYACESWFVHAKPVDTIGQPNTQKNMNTRTCETKEVNQSPITYWLELTNPFCDRSNTNTNSLVLRAKFTTVNRLTIQDTIHNHVGKRDKWDESVETGYAK